MYSFVGYLRMVSADCSSKISFELQHNSTSPIQSQIMKVKSYDLLYLLKYPIDSLEKELISFCNKLAIVQLDHHILS